MLGGPITDNRRTNTEGGDPAYMPEHTLAQYIRQVTWVKGPEH